MVTLRRVNRIFAASDPNRAILYVGNTDGKVLAWNITAAPTVAWSAIVGGLTAVASIDSGALVACADDRGLSLLNSRDGTLVERVEIDSSGFPMCDVAFSPDGRWVAAAGFAEEIRLVARAGWVARATVEGGEYVLGISFDPLSRRLATGCSFQGGAQLRIDTVGAGSLNPLHDRWRATYETLDSAFVDKITSISFSRDGGAVALFETAAVGHYEKPPGWRGNVAVYAAENGDLVWERSITSELTGDTRTLAEAGSPAGFYTRIAFAADGSVVCGTTNGVVLAFDAGTGSPRRLGMLGGEVLAILSDRSDRLWAVTADGTPHPL
jgi:WD40 repeat protein